MIIAIEHLHGLSVVLGEGVAGGSFNMVTNPRALVVILRERYLSLGHAKAEETYTSFPIEI